MNKLHGIYQSILAVHISLLSLLEIIMLQDKGNTSFPLSSQQS